ncbi:type II secretion system F family protein [bacterium]|nr:type II secretion system F family protein [bacterium]
MRYRYTGVTRQRERVQGVIEGLDEAEARLRLRSMQIRPESLAPAPDRGAPGSGGGLEGTLRGLSSLFEGKVKLKQLILFTKQFSSLIDSGVPVVQGLEILALQEKKGRLKSILEGMKADIEGGNSLANALAGYPGVFSEFFVRIVEAGELSGTLDRAIKQVGVQLEKLDRLKAKVIKALSYPLFTLVIAIGVLIFLLVKVVPEISKLYAEGKAELPELTQFVLAMSKWFQANFLFVVAGLIGFAFSAVALYRMPSFRQKWDPFVLKVPLFGSLVMRSAVAQFTRTLGTLVASGVPLIAALEICQKLMTNLAVRDSVRVTIAFIQEGKTIAAGLAARNIYPPMVIHMVNIGEMTGRLDELLNKVANIYDDEVDDAINSLTSMLQPAIILIVGVIVAFLLLAMYLPVFQLADKVAGGG